MSVLIRNATLSAAAVLVCAVPAHVANIIKEGMITAPHCQRGRCDARDAGAAPNVAG